MKEEREESGSETRAWCMVEVKGGIRNIGIRYKGVITRKKDMKVCVVNIHIRDEGDDPDPRVACRPPHRQHGLLHLSCIDDDAPNLIYFIALRYGKLALHFVLKEVISFLDFGKVECF